MDSFPGHLEQIVNNVIMNSITNGFEGREGGQISIVASCSEGLVELFYSDDGHGIAPHLQHKMFEPFYTTKLGQGGSGLGLSIVHNLVQAIFKGRLWLESAPGQGGALAFFIAGCDAAVRPTPPSRCFVPHMARCLTCPYPYHLSVGQLQFNLSLVIHIRNVHTQRRPF